MEQQNVDSPEEPPDEGEGPKTPEDIRQDVICLLDDLDANRSERGQINLDAVKGKAKARLTQEVADLNAECERDWTRIAEMLGAETAARLRVRFEPWRLDSSETAPSIDELYDEVVAPLPEYPHCACGARLVLDAEQVSGKCEACAIDSAIDSIGQTRTTAAESQSSPANPVDVPLPFPAAPVERFDFHAAFTDIGKHNRDVEARQKVYLDLNERAKDAKKQWEAAASSLTLMIAEYDRKAREAEEAEARQEKLSAAYTEKLEADAAKAAAPELPIAAAPTAESRVMADESAAVDEVPPESGSVASGVAQPNPTPLSDALPTCACGAALALDTERARGECDDCAWQRVEGK